MSFFGKRATSEADEAYTSGVLATGGKIDGAVCLALLLIGAFIGAF